MDMQIQVQTAPGGQPQPIADHHPQLIRCYQQRMDRHRDKRQITLRLLRDEIWTSVSVLASVLGVSHSSAHRLVKGMVQDGLLSTETFTIRGERGVRVVLLVGITHHGLAHAWDMNEAVEHRSAWEPSKINPLYVPHTLEVQEARIAAERLGWTNWVPGRLLANKGMAKVPDALVTSGDGTRVAVELERHIKSMKRYEVVLGSYVADMKQGPEAIDRVDYLCPTADMAARLARTLGLIKNLRFEGNGKEPARVGPLAQEHLDRFRFFGVREWPGGAFVRARLGGNIDAAHGGDKGGAA